MIFYDGFGFVIKIFVIEVDIPSSEPYKIGKQFMSLVMHIVEKKSVTIIHQIEQ